MSNAKVIAKLQVEMNDLEKKMSKLENALDRPDISRPQKRLMRNQLISMMDYYTALKLRVIDLLDADGVN